MLTASILLGPTFVSARKDTLEMGSAVQVFDFSCAFNVGTMCFVNVFLVKDALSALQLVFPLYESNEFKKKEMFLIGIVGTSFCVCRLRCWCNLKIKVWL